MAKAVEHLESLGTVDFSGSELKRRAALGYGEAQCERVHGASILEHFYVKLECHLRTLHKGATRLKYCYCSSASYPVQEPDKNL
jgi:hypothetical protein